MNEKKDGRGGAGRGQGRKPLPEGAAMVPVSVKMRRDQRAKLNRLGGAPWIRDKIDKAKEPKEDAAPQSDT